MPQPLHDITAFPNASAVLAAAKTVLDQHDHLRDLAIQVQQIPSPTDFEDQCVRWVADYLIKLGIQEVSIDDQRNVLARIPGVSRQPGVLVSAHTDTVFPAETDLSLRVDENEKIVYGPSIGDNSSGVAGLLGLAEVLVQLDAPPVDIWLVANSGEEGLGDLRGMKAVVDRLVDQIGACIVLEGMGLTRIVHQGLGSKRFRITVEAPGGHSWSDFGAPSAIHILTQMAAEISKWAVPESPRTTFNIGRIEGGRSVNTIAQTATLELDLRSEAKDALAALVSQTEALTEGYRAKYADTSSVTIGLDVIGDRPTGQIEAGHPLVQAAVAALNATGLESASLRMSSTDANVPLSRNIPAVCVGITEGGGAHRMEEWINSSLIPYGVHHVILLTWWAAHWLDEQSGQ